QELLPSLPKPSPYVRPAAYLLPLSRLVKMVDERVWEDVERYSELIEACRYGGPPSEDMYRETVRCVEEIMRVFKTVQQVLSKGGQSVASLISSSGQWTQSRSNIKLQPSTSNYDISLKILVDGQEPRRLPAILRGSSLSWESALSRDLESDSRIEIRVYEKHRLGLKRVGTLEYTVSTVVNQVEASLEFDTKQFTALISFPTPDEFTGYSGTRDRSCWSSGNGEED
ncbi:hypothetical protein BDV93DRAFT_505918, partial [Ceratobasidium sp. AG-I]